MRVVFGHLTVESIIYWILYYIIEGDKFLTYQNFQFIAAQVQLFQFYQERERPECANKIAHAVSHTKMHPDRRKSTHTIHSHLLTHAKNVFKATSFHETCSFCHVLSCSNKSLPFNNSDRRCERF